MIRKAAPLLLLPFLASGCADKFPLPEEFDAAFTTGQVCVPSQVATGDGVETYPVRFDLCLYRCVSVDRSTATVRTVYRCGGGQCQMVMLVTAHAYTIDGEEGCDARDLVDPPEGECTSESFEFNVGLPTINGEKSTGNFSVSIPYLELEQGQNLVDRLAAGENPSLVVQEEVGAQNYPERQFVLNFDPAHPVRDAASLTSADCKPISAP